MSALDMMATARTLLFVPGDRPERFDKAVAVGADLVIVDLEDAVAPPAKDEARAALAAWLSPERSVLVRVNDAGHPGFAQDLALAAGPGVVGIVLPKATEGAAIKAGAADKPILALIESARGVAEMNAIAATPGVVRLAIGAIDLAGDLGMGPEDYLLDPIRLQMTLVSRLEGLAAPVDGVTAAFKDEDRLAADVARARSLGFGGKLCIHPTQVEGVRAGFAPTPQQVEWAHRMLDADARAAGGAVSVDGEMIDKPIVDRARRILGLL